MWKVSNRINRKDKQSKKENAIGGIMPIKIDPITRQRIVFSKHVGDVEYDLEGDSAVINESVKVIGPWADHTGTGGPKAPVQQMWGGITNQFFGEDIALEGAKLGNLNEVGENADLYRRRRIRRTIDVRDTTSK